MLLDQFVLINEFIKIINQNLIIIIIILNSTYIFKFEVLMIIYDLKAYELFNFNI